ncbi:hypothetical protein [Streptomyces sennicomposti]|uniref:hypothetical protein n=1 Tax=Streptomyces sennicomposti TaxID=2873384 RepID=UPI001CA76427|nr:hypothetical protein [Streptomyces sennicomposti]MBY8868711.1 hypothetical protein [Streptomyces sennicomposti]
MTASSQLRVIWTSLDSGRGPDRQGHRRLVITVGVLVVLLIAALGAAISGWSSNRPAAGSTSGTSHSRDGAQSAAARIARAFGSEQMFSPEARHRLLKATVDPARQPELIKGTDEQYAPLAERLGLDEQGRPPAGAQFVSRATPSGTAVRSYTGATATVDVWCSTLWGLTGKSLSTQIPVKAGWLTMTVSLRWAEDGWRLTDLQQKDGPEPADDAADQFGAVPQT